MLEPKQYMKKPVLVEALQWTGDNFVAVDEFVRCHHETFPAEGRIILHTRFGRRDVQLDEWIILDEMNDYWVYTTEELDRFYKLVGN